MATGTTSPAGAAEPTLDDIAREYPRWHCWHGISGLYYARLIGASPPVIVRGEDPMDLRDEIRRWLAEY
jgi:hypothetical protein